MKLINNKGITLIALTITIIVLLIIAGISVYTGSRLIQEAKYEDVKTNMMLVQAEVKKYIEQANFEKKSVETVASEGVTLNGINLKLENVAIDEKTYYKITNPTMNELKLSKLSKDDYLLEIKNEEKSDETKPDIVDINFDVYFAPGIINDKVDKPYHLLSEMN